MDRKPFDRARASSITKNFVGCWADSVADHGSFTIGLERVAFPLASTSQEIKKMKSSLISHKYLRQLYAFLAIIFCVAIFPHGSDAQGNTSGAFKGIIADKLTGQPIEGAKVAFTDIDTGVRGSGVTASEGTFSTTSLPPGVYTIEISALGYETLKFQQKLYAMASYAFDPTPTLLNPSDKERQSDVGAFTGTLMDPITENAVKNVKVTLKSQNSDGATRTYATDPSGNFLADTLAPGNYIIEFSADGYEPRKVEATLYAMKTTKVGKGNFPIVLIPLNNGKQLAESSKNAIPKTAFGEYYALIIGNDNYQGSISKLANAVNDATTVESVLTEKYGFKTKLLLNAKGRDIREAINRYKLTLNENDNLLIYYSGHGFKDVDVIWSSLTGHNPHASPFSI